MKANMKAVVGDVKVTAIIYPQYEPLYAKNGEITDIKATWPATLEVPI